MGNHEFPNEFGNLILCLLSFHNVLFFQYSFFIEGIVQPPCDTRGAEGRLQHFYSSFNEKEGRESPFAPCLPGAHGKRELVILTFIGSLINASMNKKTHTAVRRYRFPGVSTGCSSRKTSLSTGPMPTLLFKMDGLLWFGMRLRPANQPIYVTQ